MESTDGAHTLDFYPYPERNSIGREGNLELLLSEPEIKLSDQELEIARSFAIGLFNGNISEDLICESEVDLETIYNRQTSESSQSFYLGYFLTDKGLKDLEQMGIVPDSLELLGDILDDIDEISSKIEKNLRKRVAVNSLNWYKAELSNLLVKDKESYQNFKDLECLSVNYDPSKLLEKLKDLEAYHCFYKLVRGFLNNQEPSNLISAKIALLNIYQARVNNMIASLYPAAISLAKQLGRSKPSDKVFDWSNRLVNTLPVVKQIYLDAQESQIQQMDESIDSKSRRLDLFKNGAGSWMGPMISPISDDCIDLYNESGTSHEVTSSNKGDVDHSLTESLESITWDTDKLKVFIESVLSELELLSQYTSTWQEAESRDDFAEDGKWQVIIRPKKKSLAVRGKKRVLFLPEEFSRSLINVSPAGVLPLCAHELTHIFQTEENYKLSSQIALAKIKGARFSSMREYAAIAQEEKLQFMLGRSKNVEFNYLKALQAKMAGANKLEVAFAFYESYTSNHSPKNDKEKLSAINLAIDRSLRLFRNNGNDSSALDYLEQELVAKALEALPDNKREAVASLCSSFNLKDSATLHNAGLLDLPQETIVSPANIIWHIFEKKFLPQI